MHPAQQQHQQLQQQQLQQLQQQQNMSRASFTAAAAAAGAAANGLQMPLQLQMQNAAMSAGFNPQHTHTHHQQHRMSMTGDLSGNPSHQQQQQHRTSILSMNPNQQQQQQSHQQQRQPQSIASNQQLVMNNLQLQQLQQLQQQQQQQQQQNGLTNINVNVQQNHQQHQQPQNTQNPQQNGMVDAAQNPAIQATLTSQQQQLMQQKKLIDQLEMQIAEHQRCMAEMKNGGGISNSGSNNGSNSGNNGNNLGNNNKNNTPGGVNLTGDKSNNNAAAVLQQQQQMMQMKNLNMVQMQCNNLQHKHQQNQMNVSSLDNNALRRLSTLSANQNGNLDNNAFRRLSQVGSTTSGVTTATAAGPMNVQSLDANALRRMSQMSNMSASGSVASATATPVTSLDSNALVRRQSQLTGTTVPGGGVGNNPMNISSSSMDANNMLLRQSQLSQNGLMMNAAAAAAAAGLDSNGLRRSSLMQQINPQQQQQQQQGMLTSDALRKSSNFASSSQMNHSQALAASAANRTSFAGAAVGAAVQGNPMNHLPQQQNMSNNRMNSSGSIGKNSPIPMNANSNSNNNNNSNDNKVAQRSSSRGSSGGNSGSGGNDISKDFALLKGSFAGGWQSNNDLPERRRIIILVAKLIDKMQPTGNDHRKLPIVAKKLEECLYRMAKTKEEYMNADTLKKRLQTIAFSIGPKSDEKSNDEKSSESRVSAEAQNRINQLRSKNRQLERSMDNHGMSSSSLVDRMKNRQSSSFHHSSMNELQSNLMKAAHSDNDRKKNDPFDSTSGLSQKQRKKVIRQQQQRLILLRHASKCKVGPSCEIKFCAQMVKLWNHMKKCRDKQCSTPHCLSSRCVLNHYKICKDENRTATCEVCAPVMEVIRYQDAEQNNSQGSQGDPFAKMLERTVDAPDMNTGNSTIDGRRNENPSPPSSDIDISLLPHPLRAKYEKLEKQYKLMMHLKHQQEKEMQEHQRNNIPRDSVMSTKLREKQEILLKCQDQYAYDKRFLEKMIKAYQQEVKEEKKTIADRRNEFKNKNFNDSMMLSSTSVNNEIIRNDILHSSVAIDTKTFNVFESEPDFLDGNTTKDSGKDSGKVDDVIDFDFGPLLSEGESQSHSIGKKRHFSELHADDLLGEENAFVEMFDFSSQNGENDKGENDDKKDNGMSLGITDVDIRPQDNLPQDALLPEALAQVDETKTSTHSLPINHDVDPEKISNAMLPLVQKILDDPYGWLFRDPVDPIELGIPDYFDIIKNPMDLSLVQKRLRDGYYKTFDSVKSDVNLVFENAIQYNGEESDVGTMAVKLLGTFTSDCRSLNI